MTNTISVFCDFDGTIISKDLGDEVFQHFGHIEPYHSRLLAGELPIREYWRAVCATLSPEVTQEKIREFALEVSVDPNFRSFAGYCRENGIPLTILSDGFDAYIKPVLERESLSGIPVYSNFLEFRAASPPVPHFPGASESCTCLCASCKRNLVLTQAQPESLIVYIGDGLSDTCAAEHADVIFAKKKLAAYCNRHRLPHYPFSNFFDILRVFREGVEKKQFRPRHQAFLRRKKSFETE